MSKQNFDKLVRLGNSIIDEYTELYTNLYDGHYLPQEHPIHDYIRLLGRKLQTELLQSTLYTYSISNNDINFEKLFFDQFISITSDGKEAYDMFARIADSEYEVQLSKDVILPWSWKQERLINSLIRIGDGKLDGEWRQDSNHSIILFLPIGVSIVEGGNHSISTGIIQGRGSIKPDVVFDMSVLYEHVFTDGENYYKKMDNSIISQVEFVEFAAIFEIGRLIIENQLK